MAFAVSHVDDGLRGRHAWGWRPFVCARRCVMVRRMSASQGVQSADVLIVAAHPVELAPLQTALAERAGPAAVRKQVAIAAVGVGVAEAGSGTARAIAEYRPTQVLLLGSAGAYPSAGLSLGGLVMARDIHLVDAAVVEGRAAVPEPMQKVPVCDPALSEAVRAAGPVGEPVSVATTVGITTDDGLAASLDAAGPWQVENLEAMAVALACESLGLAFAALFAITNEVGSQGRAQWRVQHKLSAEQTAEVAFAWLTA